MAGVSRKGVWGVRLSPSPIHYIVVIVKKDLLYVAQVILASSGTALRVRERRGRVQGGEEDHQQSQKIEVDSKFCFKISLF